MKETLKRRIQTVAIVGVALAGVGSVTEVLVEESTVNSYKNIENRIEEVVPGFNPEAFRIAERIIVDFKQKEDLTLKNIEIPENVREAAIFTKDNKTSYDKGIKLATKENSRNVNRFVFQIFGGMGAVGLSALFFISNRTTNVEAP